MHHPPLVLLLNHQHRPHKKEINMSKYAAAESIKAQIAKLETLFDKMVDGVIEATDAQQQTVIDRLDTLGEMLSNELAGIPTQWGVA